MRSLLFLIVLSVASAVSGADAVTFDAFIYRTDLDAYVQLDPESEHAICGDYRYSNDVLLVVTIDEAYATDAIGPIKYKGAVSRSISRTKAKGPTVYPVKIDPAYGLDVEIDLGGVRYAQQWRFSCSEEP